MAPHRHNLNMTQSSLLLLEKQGAFAVRQTDVPKPASGELLVEILSVGLNPVDWRIADTGYFIQNYPAVLGQDAADIVKAVGEGVADFVVGDRV